MTTYAGNAAPRKINLNFRRMSGQQVSAIAAGTMESANVPSVIELPVEETPAPGFNTAAAPKPQTLQQAIDDLVAYNEALRIASHIASRGVADVRQATDELKQAADKLQQSIPAADAEQHPSLWRRLKGRVFS